MKEYPEIDKKFPDFTLVDQNNKSVKISDYKGKKNIVLYFYPKDNTPGCTNEACDFRDRFGLFESEDTVIIGVSPDSLKTHQKFAAKYELLFPLLVDENHEIAEQLNVWQLKKNYGREYFGIVRTTFVIDKEGILRQRYKNVRVKNHVEKVLNFIKETL